MVNVGGNNAGANVVGKIEGAAQNINQDHGRQNQAFGGGGQVGEIFFAAFIALFILMMGHQRIGADADDFVKQIQGEQIVGKGAAHGAEQGQGEAGVETRLRVLLQAAHIAGRVKHRDHPEE